uniref:Uncharacterized protein n=1 Tax=Triticum urartu TaxID=4572 RepID=A0A8R7Q2U1_TRIUA
MLTQSSSSIVAVVSSPMFSIQFANSAVFAFSSGLPSDEFRRIFSDLSEVTSQDYCHSTKRSMLGILICESKIELSGSGIPGKSLRDLPPLANSCSISAKRRLFICNEISHLAK